MLACEVEAELARRVDVCTQSLVVDASGWNQLDDTDLVDVHDYGSELTKHVGARDDIPLWFGELGGFRDYRTIVEQVPDDAAGFVWTQLTDVEQEQNGLLTYDRRWKVDPATVRAVNTRFTSSVSSSTTTSAGEPGASER